MLILETGCRIQDSWLCSDVVSKLVTTYCEEKTITDCIILIILGNGLSDVDKVRLVTFTP